jgi:hypothetical protein
MPSIHIMYVRRFFERVLKICKRSWLKLEAGMHQLDMPQLGRTKKVKDRGVGEVIETRGALPYSIITQTQSWTDMDMVDFVLSKVSGGTR